MASTWAKKLLTPGAKEFLISSLVLILALLIAVASSMARRNGHDAAAVVLSVCALGVAALVSVTLLPRLLRRVKLQYLASLRLFRITKRGGLFLFLLVLIAFATFNTGNNLLVLVLSFLLAALMVSGTASNLVLHGLGVRLTVPDSVYANQEAILLLHIENRKRFFPSFCLSLRGIITKHEEDREGEASEEDEMATDLLEAHRHLPYLKPGESSTVRIQCRFQERGIRRLEGFEIRSPFPFGFFSRGREIGIRGEVVVYPELIRLEEQSLKIPYLMGEETLNRRGMGTGLYNIRDYQQGDDARFVHWKSTGKVGRLMVKEFIDETDHLVRLAFSPYLPERDDKSLASFEKVVSLLGSIVREYSAANRSFFFYSGEYEMEMNHERGQFRELMEYLALVQPTREDPVDAKRLESGTLFFSAGPAGPVPRVACIDFLQL